MRNGFLVAAAILVAALAIFVARGKHAAPAHDSAQDAWKAGHAARVVAELRARDVSHLSPEQRANRARNLEALLDYGVRGRFAQNEDYPGEAIPHLIDRHGTRCALANLIDVAGDGALLERLAKRNNIAFLPELKHDEGLGRWLDAQGLTVEEAAYIQGPGFVDPGPVDWDNPDFTDPFSPRDGRAGPTTPTLPGGRLRGRGSSTVARWEAWWRLNRHAFLNLRARYHDSAVVTGERTTDVGRRASDAEVDATVIPLLKTLALGKDKQVRATALMAWARAARAKHAPEVVKTVRAYIGDKSNLYRDLMILALGVVRHEDALADLRGILHDTKDGRALLAKNGNIPERTRAYAAIALGQSGQPEAAADLQRILEDGRTKSVDLKACAVMSLGALAKELDSGEKRRITGFLIKNLRAGAWGDVVLAAVPTALAKAGDETVLVPELQPILERFRKPTAVRQSSALAMATLGPRARPGLLDGLIATARRDPDDNARRFGILAIGEMAHAQPASDENEPDAARAAVARKLERYYRAAFAGRNIQKSDLAWLCISGALFGRGFPEHAAFVRDELLEIVTKGGMKERQAAAVTALGLLGDKKVLPQLHKLYDQSKDKLIKGTVAETLGVLGDKSRRAELLEVVRTDGEGELRYRAAVGLGFTADPALIAPLVETLATTKSGEVKAALARVLGELGDRRALPALIRVANDHDADVWTRRRALGAIGMIAQKSDHAWTTAFQRGVNFPHATPTLREVLSLF